MKKRNIALLMMGTMVLTGIVGCGSKETEKLQEPAETVSEAESVASSSVESDMTTETEEEKTVTEEEKEQEVPQENVCSYKWVVEPTIEADDMFLVRKTGTDDHGGFYYNNCVQFEHPYTVIKKDGMLDLIDMDGQFLTNMNISMIRYYYYYEMGFATPQNLTGRIEIPEYRTDIAGPDQMDKAFFTGEEFFPIEHGDAGYTDYYYTVDNTLHSNEEIYHPDALQDVPGMLGVPQAEAPCSSYDETREFYTSLDSKFALCVNQQVVTDYIYDACGGAVDGLMAVSEDGKWGYVDANGSEIIPVTYDASWGYCIKDGLGLEHYGVFAEDEEFSDDFRDACYAPSEGYINLVKDGEWELRNVAGDLAIESGIFEKILPVYDGKCWVKKDGAWGVIQLIQ